MATVEELLEENVGKIQAFHGVLEKLKSDMEEFPTDGDFADAQKNYKASVEEMWSTVQILGVLDSAFEKSEQEIETRLKQLEDLVDAIETKVTSTDKATDEIFAKIDTGVNGLDDTLKNMMRPAEGKLITIQEAAINLKTLVEKKTGEFTESVKAYTTKADEAFGNLETRRTSTIATLDGFTTKGGQLVDAGKQAMEQALTHIEEEYDAIHEAFAEQIKAQIERAASEEDAKVKQQLQQSIDDTKQQCQDANQKVIDAKQTIENEASTVEQKAEQAAETIGEAEEKLEKVKSAM